MKKQWLSFLISLLLICSFSPSVKAASIEQPLFIAEVSKESILRGASFSVTLSPTRADISAFVLHVTCDDSVTQVKAEFSEGIQNAYTYTSSEDGSFSLVFAAANGCTFPMDESVTLTFKTDSACTPDSTAVQLEISDAADVNAVPLLVQAEAHDLEMLFQAPDSSDCRLLSLTPPTGTLSPKFDPDITEYTLSVPFSYTSLEFEAVPSDGASVRVNRKNLGSGGSTVDFRFTVTAADQKTKSVYKVSVTRLEKESSSNLEDDGDSVNGISATDTPGSLSASNTSAATENESAVIYVSTQQKSVSSEERLLTAAVVLLSVGAGMGLVVLAQRLSKKKDTEENSEH